MDANCDDASSLNGATVWAHLPDGRARHGAAGPSLWLRARAQLAADGERTRLFR
jgi:hypothetical protein